MKAIFLVKDKAKARKVYSEELINKLRRIAEFDSNFKINNIEGKISIEI